MTGMVPLRLHEYGPEYAHYQAVLEHEPDRADAEGNAEREGNQSYRGIVREEEAGESLELSRGHLLGGIILAPLARLDGWHVRR